MPDAVVLTGFDLTLEQIDAVAHQAARVELSQAARQRIAKARQLVERALAEDRPVYGITTGVGKLSDVRVDPSDLRQLQLNIVRSHAAGVGEPLSPQEARTMMLIRANTLARGHSGVRPKLIETLLEFLNRDLVPCIPSRGSVGASGDLAPSAHMALALVGEGMVLEGKSCFPAALALKQLGIAPLELEAKEGISLVNGTQAMTALGVLACLQSRRLLDAADVAGALSLEALRGSRTAFDQRIQNCRPFPGQQVSARNVLALTQDSPINESHKDCGRIQDAYSLRCIPQVHGASRDVVTHVESILRVEINSATDNPLIFADDEAIVSGGNFHGQPIALGLDYLALAMAEIASISERRIERLVNPDLSGLPAFLAPRAGLSSGFMMSQVTAAALVSENKILAHPASVDSIPTSANKEDHVSMGMTAALKLGPLLRNVRSVVAIELMCAAQGLDFLKPLEPGLGCRRAHALIRQQVTFQQNDRSSSGDISKIEALIESDVFSQLLKEVMADR